MRILAVIAASLVLVAAAGATAPPVKNLPPGPLSTIKTKAGELVSIALPKKAALSWRLAQNTNTKVVREVGEADVGSNVVIVFKALAAGRAKIVYAQTKGESSTATASKTYSITVTR
ncbi:MAG: hypothetical protein ABUS54_01760 [Actinomycetota bacterium]